MSSVPDITVTTRCVATLPHLSGGGTHFRSSAKFVQLFLGHPNFLGCEISFSKRIEHKCNVQRVERTFITFEFGEVPLRFSLAPFHIQLANMFFRASDVFVGQSAHEHFAFEVGDEVEVIVSVIVFCFEPIEPIQYIDFVVFLIADVNRRKRGSENIFQDET